ncbi:Tat binding 1-interacting protein [Rutstroemia sp. NJR-2017a WRK4]|nr:Tat binding 1-interacting protein [Rutstroemia sp. NJR-2017a WRK4]
MPPKRKSSHLSTGSTPAPPDELSISSSSATNTPIKPVPKAKKVKIEKEKAKAAPKGKAVPAAKDKNKGKESAAEKKTLDKNGKEKVKAVTGDEATEVILEYLRKENRPFSAGDVSGNLHGKVTKTLTDKLLKELFNAQLIHGKGTNGDGKGSQWVYWALQDPNASLSAEELQQMEDEIKGLGERMPELRRRGKEILGRVGALKGEMGVEELRGSIQRLRGEGERMRERLRGLKGGEGGEGGGKGVLSKEEVQRVEREWGFWGKVRDGRKKTFEGLEGMLMEGMGLSREDLWERIGVEGDEE